MRQERSNITLSERPQSTQVAPSSPLSHASGFYRGFHWQVDYVAPPPEPLRRRARNLSMFLLALLALFAFASKASGQAAYVLSSSVNVGLNSAPQSVSVNLPSGGTLSSIQVLTAGAPNLDYASVSGGSCTIGNTYSASGSCSVNVTFSPLYPGVRNGAVVLLDGSGNPMGTELIYGVGVGPLAVLTAGEITTVAGNGILGGGNTTNSNKATDAVIKLPLGEAVDGAGNLYYTDSVGNKIGKVDASGTLTYVAGTGAGGFSPDGTPAVSALLSGPAAILLDGAGNLYFTDTGSNTVREIVQATGRIKTVAGNGIQGYSGDGGAATAAELSTPEGIAFDSAQNLYIADTSNNCIRKVDATTGVISTIAGNINPGYAGDGQQASGALLNQPYGISFDSDGNLYIADFLNNRVRRIATNGIITTVAGNGTSGYSGDTRDALGATMQHPAAVVVDAAGNLYIADSDNNVVRKVNAASNLMTTLAGNSTPNSTGDGVNADSGNPGMSKPYGLALDPSGNLYIADQLGLKIREVYGTTGRILFKDIKATNTSSPISQRLDNDGNAPLQLTSIVPVSNAAIDSASTTCNTSSAMAQGDECLIGVEFKPASPGSPVTGSISVTSNAANSPASILLSGNALTIEPSTVNLKSSINPSSVGQTVTFTATISSLATTVQGVVKFYDGGTLIGSPTSDPTTRTASVQTSSLTAGSHTITAAFAGDASSAPSPTATLTQVVKQTSSLTLTSSNPQARLEDPITFTAQVLGASNLTQSETVSFQDTDGTVLDTEAVDPNSGIATSRAITSLSAGQHTITATYSGDANYSGSSKSLTQTVQKISTTTAILTSSASPSIAGGTVSFTILVTAQYSNLEIGGTISLVDNGTALPGNWPLSALGTDPATATVTVPVSGLGTGAHTIKAVYSGDSNYVDSNGSYLQNVAPATANVVLRASSATAIATTPVTFTATVTSNGGTPGGTVNFSIDGGAAIPVTLSNGTASTTTSSLAVGVHTVTSNYLGDTNDGSATSNQVSVTVVAATTTTTLTTSQNPLLTLAPLTITATVTNVGGSTPTGTVIFSQDGTAVSTATVNSNGVATLSLASLSAGTHSFVAAYSGDAINLASTSSALSEVVQLRSTTNVLTTSASSLTGGQQLTLISVVRWTGSATPTGTVSFFNGTQSIASAAVDATGVATVTVLLYGTSASVSSVYSGDASYASSTSSADLVTIGPAPNFTFTADPLTFTVATTQHQIVTVSLTSVKGFTDTISLGCLGLPLAATCNFSTDQFTLAPDGSQSMQLIVDTGNPLLAGEKAKNEAPKEIGTSTSKLILACFLPGGLLLGLVGIRFRRLRSFGGLVMLFLLLAGMSTALTGCGTIQLTSTPPSVYNFAITATGKTGVSQSIPVVMTVTQ